ncbi:MAG: energy-coupling factor transport system ATP-binding protein [Clostridia bacterium]|nr:energy-coupling factor transport system ATP-binding protein [Clostridia bacterium]
MGKVKVETLTYYYPRSSKPALENVSFTVQPGSFVLLAGGSGSGKSTLLRALSGLIPHFYGGRMAGTVQVGGLDTRRAGPPALAEVVGCVFQDPENQLVMPTVEAEVAFGLQNLGFSPALIRRRVAEVLQFFGLDHLREAEVRQLSGGQKQKLALAGVLALHPSILLLDEPTSQLDPVSAEEILQLIKRINEENGLTIILAEQRLERCLHLADELLFLENGRLVGQGPSAAMVRELSRRDSLLLPPLARLFAGYHFKDLPLTVKEGRTLLRAMGFKEDGAVNKMPENKNRLMRPQKKPPASTPGNTSVKIENLGFTYPGGKEVLKGISLELKQGEVVALIGANGAGKSTLARHFNGLLKPVRGRVVVGGRDTRRYQVEDMADLVGYLPQNPNDLLFHPTVRRELEFTLTARGLKDAGQVQEALHLLELEDLAQADPRDLSGGERQRAALAALLVGDPQVLVLDEPTRGLDYRLKAKLGQLLCRLAEAGKTVFIITHDAGFVAEYAGRVIFLSAGEIVADGPKEEVLAGFYFFTPQLYRLFYNFKTNVFTYEQARKALEEVLAAWSGRQLSWL